MGLDVPNSGASSLVAPWTEAELSVSHSADALNAISAAKLAFKFQDGCMLGFQLDLEISCIIRI